jgi:hypothetical protein
MSSLRKGNVGSPTLYSLTNQGPALVSLLNRTLLARPSLFPHFTVATVFLVSFSGIADYEIRLIADPAQFLWTSPTNIQEAHQAVQSRGSITTGPIDTTNKNSSFEPPKSSEWVH